MGLFKFFEKIKRKLSKYFILTTKDLSFTLGFPTDLNFDYDKDGE